MWKQFFFLSTNKINNKIYIGVHETENPNIFDGYIGCGVYKHQPSTYMYPKTPFQYAVKKYGVDAFERVVLFIYDDEISAYKKEAELVDLNFIKQAHVYNACIGGDIAHNYKKLYQFDLTGKLPETMKVGTYEYKLKDDEGQIYEIGVLQYGEYINNPTSYVKSNERKQYTK